jgi:DNA invertase Pin-like site-specific DNA recombinase
MKTIKYVAYYRVSTKQQATSGLGLDAQKQIVSDFIRRQNASILHEFTEIESGANDHRPALSEAINVTKENNGVLLIAKLDRLSRNLTFISTLMDNHIRFTCCDMPDASEMTIHIFASLAQWERKRISERTKAALDAKRIRDNWTPGMNNLTDEGRAKAQAKNSYKAHNDINIRKAYHFIKLLKEQGLSFYRIAKELNANGYRTFRGKSFQMKQVVDIWYRFEKQVEAK